MQLLVAAACKVRRTLAEWLEPGEHSTQHARCQQPEGGVPLPVLRLNQTPAAAKGDFHVAHGFAIAAFQPDPSPHKLARRGDLAKSGLDRSPGALAALPRPRCTAEGAGNAPLQACE